MVSTAKKLRTSPYLEGLFAPQLNETSRINLVVEGEIPAGLNGRLIFNSSNPRMRPKGFYSWFDGDGMVHATTIGTDGCRYVNRYVRSRGFIAEEKAQRPLYQGLIGKIDDDKEFGGIKDSSNTAVIWHAGKLLSLWHLCGDAYALNPETLETEAMHAFAPDLRIPVAAHTKADPRTGELIFFNYNLLKPPHMHYGVVSRSGAVHYTPIELKAATYGHDIAITENYSILIDMPLEWRGDGPGARRRQLYFNRERPTRFGVLARMGANADVRWFEAKPCYMYHIVNAFEKENTIEVYGCRIDDPMPEKYDPRAPRDGAVQFAPNFYRWVLDLKTGGTREEQLDDTYAEFPRINDNMMGEKYRFSYHGRFTPGEIRQDALIRYDRETGDRQIFEMPAGYYCNEPVYAPMGKTGEAEGFILTYVCHAAANGAVWIFNAREINAGPVAKVHLPHRIPPLFHGTWLAL